MDNKEMNMESNFKNDFFTKEQLQSLINIPIHDVINDLDAYIYYEGIVSEIPFDEDPVKVYVVGFIKQTRKPVTHLNRPGYKPIFACSYECGDYCSRPELKDIKPLFINDSYDRQVYFNYSEFIEFCSKLGVPLKSNDKPIDTQSDPIENNEKQHSNNEVNISNRYPPELQLAIDAYEQLCIDKNNLPLNKEIEAWLKTESKIRGITHLDGSSTLKGLSNVKAERIASMIKSKPK
ncbi:hypothetical protein [Pseudoalteromonas tetraodonis]|uniref:hypothetical protein n=1 Tax=Pseudoalteromonas tetraodonis TaxID=43659 RepID=UPI0008699BAE|nr:hypothetical protein [Pseudoalteromonas tetraodonis]ODS15600.1 hypothetical protein BCD66_04270 [Pseudoalteromonas tetraodonis]